MKLLILDKDGTLVRPASGEEFVQHPHDQELIPGVAEVVARHTADGWKMAIASNQGGVAAGYKTLDDAIAEMKYCLSLLSVPAKTAVFCPDNGKTIEFVSNFYNRKEGKFCSHYRKYLGDIYSSNASFCGTFRKPSPGMINVLVKHCCYEDERADVLFVGDRPEDGQAAANAGVKFMWAADWRGDAR